MFHSLHLIKLKFGELSGLLFKTLKPILMKKPGL
jgi:hypothetical protein